MKKKKKKKKKKEKEKRTLKFHVKFPKFSFLQNNKAPEFQFFISVDVCTSKSNVKSPTRKGCIIKAEI